MRELVATILEQLDEIGSHAVDNREVLLHFYKEWPEDRLLGPPFKLGQSESSVALPEFRNQLIALGGPAASIQRTIRAIGDMDRLFADYDAGAYAGRPVSYWRHAVERAYAALGDALRSAEVELKGWKRPDGGATVGKEYMFKEDIARFFDIAQASAQKGMGEGRYGPVVTVGKAHAVKTIDFIATLDASREDRKPDDDEVARRASELGDKLDRPTK